MVSGIILICLGLFLNQWILAPFIHLPDGQVSVFRVAIIWIIDIVCITTGVMLIIKKSRFFSSPKKAVFTLIMLVLMLIFSECLLRIAARISPQINQMLLPSAEKSRPLRQIPDDVLGHRPNPDFPEHDTNGFRNKTSLSQADIVALGDSQTYGTSVKRHQAWPQQMGTLSDHSAYNMAYGGYGSVQGLILMENQALAMLPRHIIFMMYDGNDVFDGYRAVYGQNLYDSLKTTDPTVQETLDIAEQAKPLFSKIKEETASLWGSPAKKKESSSKPKKSWTAVKELKLFQLFFSLERTIQSAFPKKHKSIPIKLSQQSRDPNFVSFEYFTCRDFRTTFTPRYRQLGMNLEDPRIREGLRVTLEAIGQMQQRADEHSVDFLVLLLPTKERCFYHLYDQYDGTPSEALQSTVKLNNEIRKRTIEYLQQHEIAYIDTLPILKRCFEQKRQPFFENADGHLNIVGHKAIAEAVYEYIDKTQ